MNEKKIKKNSSNEIPRKKTKITNVTKINCDYHSPCHYFVIVFDFNTSSKLECSLDGAQKPFVINLYSWLIWCAIRRNQNIRFFNSFDDAFVECDCFLDHFTTNKNGSFAMSYHNKQNMRISFYFCLSATKRTHRKQINRTNVSVHVPAINSSMRNDHEL